MQIIRTISKRCKDRFKRYMDNTLYDYDCMIQERKNERFYKGISVWTKLKDKVSLATAWFNNNTSNIDFTGASEGHYPIIHSDIGDKGKLRMNERNSKK